MLDNDPIATPPVSAAVHLPNAPSVFRVNLVSHWVVGKLITKAPARWRKPQKLGHPCSRLSLSTPGVAIVVIGRHTFARLPELEKIEKLAALDELYGL